MRALTRLVARIIYFIEDDFAPLVMPLLARLVFAAIFLRYFWQSALTKAGADFSGLYAPSFNAFAQMFPKAAEAASYDITKATAFQKAVILAGTWAEFVLPVLIVIGLLTRPAALGMIVFVVVMTLTDLYGHNVIADPSTVGGFFDAQPNGLLDQRALWIMLLLIPLVRGAGPVSIDRFFARRTGIV